MPVTISRYVISKQLLIWFQMIINLKTIIMIWLSKRRLEIRIFFELNEFELCNARNEAFKNYLFTRTKKKKEDNFPATTFDPNNHFVNFVTTLLNLTKHDKAKIKALLWKNNRNTCGCCPWLVFGKDCAFAAKVGYFGYKIRLTYTDAFQAFMQKEMTRIEF